MKRTVSKARHLVICLLVLTLLIPFWAYATKAFLIKPIPAEKAADYIHAVIEADRTIYSQYIVDRLEQTISLKATENWEKDNTLLLPAQFLLLSSNLINSRNLKLKFQLMSLWPINPANGPKSDKEKAAFESVAANPSQPYFWVTQADGQKIFNIVYPDKAVTKGCVSCHNSHPKTPKNDFKLGDVMGGILISFPVTKANKKDEGGDYRVAPEVVADYVHSILEADRTVYSKYIVNRLQKKHIIYPSENWWEENTLLLPAQFLLNASDLIRNMRLGLDYRLISLWPINPHNGPSNEFERIGLESVSSNPMRPYINTVKIGNKGYFQAVYPDYALTPACISCHNSHPNSPRRDFKLYDVMGGIVINLPVEIE